MPSTAPRAERSFLEPTAALPKRFKTGALGERLLDAQQVLVHARAKVVPRAEVVEKSERAMAGLRAELGCAGK